MALTNSRSHRIMTLCALYVAQGVPWGFMMITLPAYLLQTFPDVVDDKEVGTLTGIILFPWTFKLIWAPLMDNFTFRPMGRRRPWIIGAELAMAATLFTFLGLNNPSHHLSYIMWMYFLHNCFASLQDVCTDALAVDVLPPHEQGSTNGLMWGSKLVGRGIGGWGLTFVINSGGIEACVWVQFAILVAIMLVPLFILERPGERRFPWSSGEAQTSKDEDSDGESRAEQLKEWLFTTLRALSLTSLWVYIIFTLLKLVGTGINEVVAKSLFIKQMGWTAEEFAKVNGLYSTIGIVIATVGAGALGDYFGRRKVLILGFGGYAAIVIAFAMMPHMWTNRTFASVYIIGFEGFNAIASVGFPSLAMRISWSKASATVFTVYMTLSNVSHIAGNFLAGRVRSLMMFGASAEDADRATILRSYELTFYAVVVLALLPLVCLFWVRTEEVDAAKEEELKLADEKEL